MRFVTIFILLSLLLFGMCLSLLWVAAPMRGTWFYIAEAFGIASLLMLLLLYYRVIRPIRSVKIATDILREQNFNTRLRRVGQKDVDGIVDTFNPMMERLREQYIRIITQERIMSILVEESPIGVLTITSAGHISTANPAACSFLGINKADIDKCDIAISDLSNNLATFIRGMLPSEQGVETHIDGIVYRIFALSNISNGVPRMFYLIENLSDIIASTRKDTYKRTIRIIAHEVNNTVNSITTALDVVADEVSGDSAEAIGFCSQRVRELVTFINRSADVARLPKAILKRHDMREYLAAREIAFQKICEREHVEFQLDDTGEPFNAPFDENLLDRALTNIIKNAAESNGASEVVLRRRGNEISVIDNGEGLSADIQGKIFNPFFTTKKDGHGIGLMLTADILESHKCRYSLFTTPEGTTVFKILFPPIINVRAQRPTAPEPSALPPTPTPFDRVYASAIR